MNIDKAYNVLSKYYNTDINKIKYLLDLVFNDNIKDKYKDIILPFSGKINKNNCKAVVYNHGLYTQCINVCNNICKSCASNMIDNNLKYGHIENRLNYPIGTYEYNNKKEVKYEDFIKKMGYNKEDVITALRIAEINYTLNENKSKTRGRPKKDIQDEEIEIEVREFRKGGRLYMLTRDNILLDDGKLVGILRGSDIIEVDI